jgi:hypothetical protein
MDNAVRNVRSYVKKTIVQVPETADYITRFLPSAPNSLLLSSQDQLPESSPTTLLSPLLDSPFHELGYLSGSSSQLRMIQSPQDDTQKLASKFRRMEELLKDSGFDSVGELLKVLFYNPSRTSGESDPRGTFHVKIFRPINKPWISLIPRNNRLGKFPVLMILLTPTHLLVIFPSLRLKYPSRHHLVAALSLKVVMIHNPDPSNNHLVSGSDYDIYISEDGLTHRAWYEQENELENSSDEEEGDFDHGLFSEGEIGEDSNLYDSD